MIINVLLKIQSPVILLCPGDPTPEVELLVSQFSPFIRYIDGDVMSTADLERVDAHNAKVSPN